MEVLLKQKSEPGTFLKIGDIVDGTVIEKRGSRIFVDLGARGTGIVYGREYYAATEIVRGLAVGDAVTAKVVEVDNDEGYVELSLKEAGREKSWQDLRQLMETREPLTLKVLDANRGGLILEFQRMRGFLPASQLSQEHYPRVEGGDKEKIFEELKKLVGQDMTVTILDIDPNEEKLIFSEKTRETELVRQKLSAYQVGDVIEGDVAGLVSFGAFVRFGEGLEGLVHISEIDWQLITNPADVLSIGQKVKAKIIAVEGERVSLSLKALKEDPWSRVEERYHKGDLVTGTVVKFNPFGAFVKLDEDIQGLAHISEFGTEARMKELLTLGSQQEFRIITIDAKEHRMALGMPASPELQRGEPDRVVTDDAPKTGEATPAA
ncbi:S1 RNA-binding domain-containing protein [Candidatus Parcubacteria bacterium]|nr:MAG: S1 RNA-binding domain-containing protein [Candidatus Parcubacteria bacterium]